VAEPVAAEGVLSALSGLQSGLQEDLQKLGVRRGELTEQEELTKREQEQLRKLEADIESTLRLLELVETTKRQMTDQARGQPGLEGAGPGASVPVW
jgi:hypothetical protein